MCFTVLRLVACMSWTVLGWDLVWYPIWFEPSQKIIKSNQVTEYKIKKQSGPWDRWTRVSEPPLHAFAPLWQGRAPLTPPQWVRARGRGRRTSMATVSSGEGREAVRGHGLAQWPLVGWLACAELFSGWTQPGWVPKLELANRACVRACFRMRWA